MAFDSLASFIAQLEDDRELVRIDAEVDPVIELAAITDRVCKSSAGGPALFFENVKGHSIPVVTNLLGSTRRMRKALGAASLEDVAARIAGVLQPDLPEGWLDSLRLAPQLSQFTQLAPRTVKSAPCQQVVKVGRDVNLAELPFPRSWPGEAAPSITAAQTFTRNPKTGRRDVGLSPLEIRDHDSLAVHWTPHDDAWNHFAEYRRLGQPMPVAVALGGDPALLYAATAPLPAETDECVFASFIRGTALELVKCRSIDLEVPAASEFIIEGTIDTAAPLEHAGPLGAPTGYYTVPENLPVLNVTAVTHRSNPMLPAIIAGTPPTEHSVFAEATERIFLPFVRLFVPEIVGMHVSTASRNLLFVSIRKQFPQQARRVMHALWGLKGLMTVKFIIVVDEDVDVHDENRVWQHVGANVHPGRDTVFCEGPTSFDDHAAPVPGVGHKLGLDATAKTPEEGHPRPWPQPLSMPPEILERIERRWEEFGIGRNS